MQKLTLLLVAALIGAIAADSLDCTCTTCSSCSTSNSVCNSAGGSVGGSAPTCSCSGIPVTNGGSCSSASASDLLTACAFFCTGCTGTTTASCTSSSSSSKCFPANATVTLESGAVKTMSQLAVGDRVQVNDKEFSDIYMFSHRDASAVSDFVAITTGSHSLMLTADHYLYINGRLATAKTVKLGDSLTTSQGDNSVVTKVETVRAAGLYNPHTLHGDIVVNGIKTSIYTSSIEPTLAHAALFPVRMAYKLGGGDVVGDKFSQGSDLLADVLPDGKSAY